MTTASDTDVYYDPYDTDIVNDPYPVYARLREEAPVYYNERYDFWAVSRYADVEKGLADWETFSSSRGDILELVQSDFDMPKGVMMMEDPPVHTMLRGLMSRASARSSVDLPQALGPTITVNFPPGMRTLRFSEMTRCS